MLSNRMRNLPDNLEYHPCYQRFAAIDRTWSFGSFVLTTYFVMSALKPIHNEPSVNKRVEKFEILFYKYLSFICLTQIFVM